MQSTKKRKRADMAGSPYRSPARKYPKTGTPPKQGGGRTAMVTRGGRGYLRTGGVYGRFQPRGPELKYLDTRLEIGGQPPNAIAVSSGGPTGFIIQVPQGTGADERIGRKITIKSIQLRITCETYGYLTNNEVTGDAALNQARLAQNYMKGIFCFWLVLDKQFNGAFASTADIFDDSDPKYASRKLANSERFQILSYFEVANDPVSGAVAWDTESFNVLIPGSLKTYQMYRKVNIPIEYSANTGGPAEVRSNSIYMCHAYHVGSIPTNPTGGNPSNLVRGFARIRYSDQ